MEEKRQRRNRGINQHDERGEEARGEKTTHAHRGDQGWN